MRGAHTLPTVSVRELVRNPGAVIDRVRSGERFIVARHGRPVATLQPIDGWIQCGDGHPTDIYGDVLGDPAHEASKLTSVQINMILAVNRLGRYIDTGDDDYRELMDDLVLRGLARKSSHRGMVVTGRGMVLKEWLVKRAARKASPTGRRTTGSLGA